MDGITEAMRFFIERDPQKARAQLDRLHVRYIVVPFQPNKQLFNMEYIVLGHPQSYDPPSKHIDEFGELGTTLHYRMEGLVQTMMYRLAMLKGEGIPGLRLVAEAREDPQHPERMTGLLYVVEPLH